MRGLSFELYTNILLVGCIASPISENKTDSVPCDEKNVIGLLCILKKI